MVSNTKDASKRLKKLLTEVLPRPGDDAKEKRALESFRRPKFGAKGMAVDLDYLASACADRATVAANAGDFAKAEAELSEAFRRAYWSRAVLQKGVPSTLSVVVLEAFSRGSGLNTLATILRRELEPGDPHRLFGFAAWTLRLIDWDGERALFEDSPYFEEGSQLTNATPPENVLGVICTWHLQVALRDAGFSPFVSSPYIALPIEVFAWAKRRRELGLVVPTLDHPLLTTPIARIPLNKIDLAPNNHDLLQPLFARCVKEGVLASEQIAEMTG